MNNIKKHKTNTKNIYTYYEFYGHESWEEFDIIVQTLVNQMDCKIIGSLDGIWSRHCDLEKEGFFFRLLNHDDFGNCLCNREKQDDMYYDQLEKIAFEVADILNKEIMDKMAK